MTRLRSISVRTASIVVALILAALGTWALMDYVQGVEAEALKDAELVEVYVAKAAVPEGTHLQTAISRGLIDTAQIPRKSLPSGAVTELGQVANLVAHSPVLEGEILQQGRFAQPGQTRGVFDIPDGHEAMSVEVGVPPGVAGFLEAGDRVSVIGHVDIEFDEPAGEGATGDEENERVPVSGYVLQDVEVLAVGQRVVTVEEGDTNESLQRSEGRILVTLAVTPDEALSLTFATLEGDTWFTLLPEGAEPHESGLRTIETLLPGVERLR